MIYVCSALAMLAIADGYEIGLWRNSATIVERTKEQTEEDLKASFDWLQKAANVGDAKALNSVGDCLQFGKGVDKDYVAAIRNYLRAANSGYVDGIFNLGLCYLNGIGVEKDVDEARAYFERASRLGHADAHCFMGLTSLLVERSESEKEAAAQEAVQWLLKAAEKGSIRAMRQLGKCYLVSHTENLFSIKTHKKYTTCNMKDTQRHKIHATYSLLRSYLS